MEEKKEAEEVKEEVKEEPKEKEVSESERLSRLEQELKELREFKTRVEEREAEMKKEEEATKKGIEQVDVSGSYFSKNEQVIPQKEKSNSDKMWDDLLNKGIPKYEE